MLIYNISLLSFYQHLLSFSPFWYVGIDIIGKITSKRTNGHQYVLVAIDYSQNGYKQPPTLKSLQSMWLGSSSITLYIDMTYRMN